MGIGIYQPDGQLIQDSIRESRRLARRDFATECGAKWGHLWELGYRAKVVRPDQFCVVLHSQINVDELKEKP